MGFDFSGIAPPPEEKTLVQRIVDRAKGGEVVPIISNSFACNLAFRDYGTLVKQWANEIKYANAEHDLAQIAQYESVSKAADGHSIDTDAILTKDKYLDFLKRALFYIAQVENRATASKLAELKAQADLRISDLAAHLDIPSLVSSKKNPLLLLAALPLPIYLTTSYHKFLEAALTKVKKKPRSDICRWHPGLYRVPSPLDQQEFYDPDPDRPLVYHLHGMDDYPRSLVLTEDDYLDFLTNISTKDSRVIHPRVNQALTQSDLILVGYGLSAWEFRVLFRGIIKPRPQTTSVKNVAIQLEESPFEKWYAQKYLQQARFEIEWTDAHKFISDIYQGCEVK